MLLNIKIFSIDLNNSISKNERFRLKSLVKHITKRIPEFHF